MRVSVSVGAWVLLVCYCFFGSCSAWSGHTMTISVAGGYSQRYCCRHFIWCTRHCYRWITTYHQEFRCRHGWKHNGNYDCSIPICQPPCSNGGTCQNPNDCKCPTYSQGRYTGCNHLTCSYQRPCFPGNCRQDQSCVCDTRFQFDGTRKGCTRFHSPSLIPIITKSTVTLANTRRTDRKTNFFYKLDATKKNDTEILWSNQKQFNNLSFELDSLFEQPSNFPSRPTYMHETDIGIINSYVEVNVSKVARNGGVIRDPGFNHTYQCQGQFSRRNPAQNLATCTLIDDQYRTLMDHADWMNIKFFTESGGYQDLINLDKGGQPYATYYYDGLTEMKQVEFRFDFIAPKHCSEREPFKACQSNDYMLKVDKEFTKDPIKVTWSGWQDDLSGIFNYYVEFFKLGPSGKLTDALIELKPLQPTYSVLIPSAPTVTFPVYKPTSPGMYSVLLTTADKANNTKIARRLFLYDNKSAIEISKSSSAKLYVSSAVPDTDYKWQTMTSGNNVTFVVNWTDHFVNLIHKEGKFLDKVAPYPIQFEALQDDNILSSKKFVADELDDHEGNRTVESIPNFNGVVKFEMKIQYLRKNVTQPSNTWETISPISQTTTFQTALPGGDGVLLTIRATDIMGNVASDVTKVRVDSTPPKISDINDPATKLQLNIKNGTYNFTSRVTFSARDSESGVFRLGYTIILHLANNDMVVENTTKANIGKLKTFDCNTLDGVCYLSHQTLDLDNCLFMVNKDDLETANATLVVSAYNQAMLTANTSFEVGRITKLKGLEKYSGPTNFKVVHTTAQGFRVTWDLPEKTSCYGLADVVIALLKKDANGQKKIDTFYASGAKTYFDILGLDAVTNYNLTFGIKSLYAPQHDIGISLAVKTAAPEEGGGVGAPVIVGVAIGVLAVVALALAVFVVLVRRGVIHPRERAQLIGRAVTRKYRQTVYGDVQTTRRSPKSVAYDNRQSELYIYGEMDLAGPQVWEINRNDVGLETVLKTGHFAQIYKATLKTGKSSDSVVAKVLKERYTADDELLMKAKINFSGTVIGDHPNVLKFIGAVTDDPALGPFIIYEYCENGPLRDFMAARKNEVTMELQESMFRFGLDIARGMEYLASKGIVHRRLAARNILLTFLNEAKISGFGPQPKEDEEVEGDAGKRSDCGINLRDSSGIIRTKERIPMKWMAPECMKSTKGATEQSDVWSYAVVLWEIFAFGDAPYANIRGRDLPTKIKHGTRLLKPESCDDTWYDMMNRCWSYDATKRPSFSDIRSELDTLFEAAPGEDYYYYKR